MIPLKAIVYAEPKSQICKDSVKFLKNRNYEVDVRMSSYDELMANMPDVVGFPQIFIMDSNREYQHIGGFPDLLVLFGNYDNL